MAEEGPATGGPASTAPSAGPPDVSAVIVHYETPELLVECLTALRATTDDVSVQAFVVDNASDRFDPEACERAFPGVTVIRNDRNLGFATASNAGLRLATGRYLLLLNPDACVEPDTLRLMVDELDRRPDVGCATCRVELPDGSLDLACRRLFPTPVRSFYRMSTLSKVFPRSRRFGQYNLTYVNPWQETEIDAPCGAFMMVRAAAAAQVGLLDERYFMYGEDMDWAFRIKAAGWKIVYTPITTVRHVKRASSRKDRSRTIGYFYEAMRLFYADHYRDRYPRWVSLGITTAIGLRERLELSAEAVRARGRERAAR